MAEPEFEQIVDAVRHGWQPIETYEIPVGLDYSSDPVLVDNGEIVGEAQLRQDFMSWDDEDQPPFRWSWTYRSTCGCCHSFMNPQPKWWQPLPQPAERIEPCDTASASSPSENDGKA